MLNIISLVIVTMMFCDILVCYVALEANIK